MQKNGKKEGKSFPCQLLFLLCFLFHFPNPRKKFSKPVCIFYAIESVLACFLNKFAKNIKNVNKSVKKITN
ncbi:hypothetical protein COU37_01820 [Candidatus Micrarchaeota archaeon CG10_big_fil_rev_8_21_14_0_10_45_29]|nr:MAG: hypothetical protein COU37_01820 [Candidatus Micrarchaeota archaeon CG10_big_fil_rev_8_21_14_0_10_45_29]